jgi:hypothetical protein
MGIIHQSGPIDGTHHDRLTRAEKNVTDRLQRIVDGDGRFYPTAEQRVSKRRRDVETKGGDGESGRFRCGFYGG